MQIMETSQGTARGPAHRAPDQALRLLTGLEDLNLEVNAGEILGHLGPNGAGKTTTIRLLLGLIKPTAGRAEVFGMDAQRQKVAVHARVAYVPGEATLWPARCAVRSASC